ncbi:hypothetical protein [Pontibacter burrus]|uniref:Uncharacterized protein n=1 Tax=Pontibacter burrus TaxID=2704466 RepID=A0A6B3M167_9BACT|nr:hypothetical protein [Pontibacter burrus]NEM99331.1 hypothetical protein [Pontibacter burrus]
MKGFFSLLVLTILSLSAFGQQGTTNYKADAMHLMFFNVGSDKPISEPVLMGRSLKITYNSLNESLVVEYTDAKEGTRNKLFLDFLRYDEDTENGLIMKDRHGNMFTVYIYDEDSSINIVSHKLVNNKYVAVQTILNII